MNTSTRINAITAATLPEGDHKDTIVPNLMLRVGSRRRSWVIRHYVKGKQERTLIGYFPAVGVAEARDKARKALERVEQGLTHNVEPVPHPRSRVETLGDLIDQYETLRTREGVKVKTLPKSMAAVRAGLKDYLNVPATQFSKSDLKAARDALNKRAPTAANRLIAYTSPVLQWASEEDKIAHNFAGDIRKGLEAKRKRVLSGDEIARIWHACDALGTSRHAANFGRLVKFLLLTAQRRSEGALLRRGDIVDGLWHQIVNKPDRPLKIRLSRQALALVAAAEHSKEAPVTKQSFVFEGDPGKAISGFSKMKVLLDEKSGVDGWRLHDLRRSAATMMQELDISQDIIGAILNHSGPAGVAGVYMHAEMEKAKAKALQKWADKIERIVKGTK